MNNNDFRVLVDNQFKEVVDKFKKKNQAYGDNHQSDVFNNFRSTASRIMPDRYEAQPEAAMFQVAETLVDKHNVALAKGIGVPDAKERLLDRIVYSLMEIALIEEQERKYE